MIYIYIYIWLLCCVVLCFPKLNCTLVGFANHQNPSFTKKPHAIGNQWIDLNQSLNNCIIPYLLLLHLHSKGNAEKASIPSANDHVNSSASENSASVSTNPESKTLLMLRGMMFSVFNLGLYLTGNRKGASINTLRQQVISQHAMMRLDQSNRHSTVSSGSGEAAHTLIAKQPDHSLIEQCGR